MTTAGRIRLKQAAAMLGIHAETLRRWARDGLVTYWAVGKGRYMEFDPHDIEALDHSFKRDRPEPPVHYRVGMDTAVPGVDITVVAPRSQAKAVERAAKKAGVPLKKR